MIFFVKFFRVCDKIGKFARKLIGMSDNTTELLQISSYVIGILTCALICSLAALFYYRRKLKSVSAMEKTPTAFLDGASALCNAVTTEKREGFTGQEYDDEHSAEQEKGEAKQEERTDMEIREREAADLEITQREAADLEMTQRETVDLEMTQREATVPSLQPERRMTKAALAEELLYEQVTSAIVDEKLYLKPGFGRSDIVERFHISSHRAGMMFSKRNTSIPEFVRNCRLGHACELMKESPLTNLADIAAASGFIHLSTFIRDFKDRFRMTPARFRETM